MAEKSKSEKFRELAENRLEKAVHSIELLTPLSDRKRYEFSEEQAKYIVKTLKESVRNVESAFQGKVNKKITLP
jgi:hypothetical protein